VPSIPATDTPTRPRASLNDLYGLVAQDMQAVNHLIERRLRSDVALVNEVAQYIVHSGGKRLRPLLVLLAARAAGYRGNVHIALAVVIELIHTATLLHDDVVDASALRRGQESANAVWGDKASVLVGDFLYSRAFQMLVEVGNMRIMQILADTTNVISEGEVLQLVNCRDPDTSEAQYLRVVTAKTAKLFEAATRIGAVVNGLPAETERALAAYGLHLGVAYQLVDDVLDYRGSADEIGKNLGDDLAEGKPTLPLIQAIRASEGEQAALLRESIRSGGLAGIDRVIAAVESTGAITYTARAAAAEADQALAALAEIQLSPYRDALEALAEFSVNRSY